jgi:hypothetical protein
MLPVMEGMIARRILLNWWVEPEVAQRLLPAPFTPALVNGYAVAGICLIRLEQMRPAGMPAALGVASENLAHRIAVRYPCAGGWRDGVYIWRRDTDSLIATLLGGRLFPGVHRDAEFQIREDEDQLEMNVLSADGRADVAFHARSDVPWKWSLLFPRFTEVCSFFERGSHGFSCRLEGQGLEGIELRTQRWEMRPLAIHDVHATFFEDTRRFPRGSAGLDSAAIMRGIPHTWHELEHVPQLQAMPVL